MSLYCFRCGRKFKNKQAVRSHRTNCTVLRCIRIGALPSDFFLMRAEYEAGVRAKPPVTKKKEFSNH